MPGSRAHNVPIDLTILLKIALIAARGHNSLIPNRNHHHCVLPPGCFNADLPRRAVRPATDGLYIATEIQKCGFHTVVPQHAQYAVASGSTDLSAYNFKVEGEKLTWTDTPAFGAYTQRYLTQSPKIFLQGKKVWLMSLCLKAGVLRHNVFLPTAFQREISGKRYRTFHRVSRISFSNCSIASCRLGTCASVQENCWPNSGRDSVSTQCVSTSGVRGCSSRRKITP